MKNRKRFSLTEKTISIGICMMLATIIWLFNNLNKQHSSQVPASITLSQDQSPIASSVFIKSSGWELLRYKLGLKSLELSAEKIEDLVGLESSSYKIMSINYKGE